ncbi:MAG: hypothetical protein R3F37_17075 [Candidatus Competibacteraceae bacterium]
MMLPAPGLLGDETGLLAWFQLNDALRPGAAEAVAALQAVA